MKPAHLPILVVLLVLIPAGGIFYLVSSPRLLGTSPAPDSAAVPAGAAIQLTFSHRMQAASVEERLVVEPRRSGSFTWSGKVLTFTPDQPWPSGQTIRVRLEPGAQVDGLLALAINEELSFSFKTGHPQLSYLYPADAAANLHILNPLSGESQRITSMAAGVLEYDVSADGTSLFFSAPNTSGGSDLYRLSLVPETREDGPELLLDCGKRFCRAPKVSPDIRFLAYEQSPPSGSRSSTTQVWLVALDGTVPLPAAIEQLTAAPNDAAYFLAGDPDHYTTSPTWSSEGWLAFYDADLKAYILHRPDGDARFSFPNQTGYPGVWDPAGGAFVAPEISILDSGPVEHADSAAQSGGIYTGSEFTNSQLIRFNLASAEGESLSSAEDLEDTSPAYSPDGSTLAFARRYLDVERWTPGRQLWLMNADGSQARSLSDAPYYHHSAFAWNPNGDQLAYVRFNQMALTEPPEIWLVDPTSAQTVRVVTGGYSPQWIP